MNPALLLRRTLPALALFAATAASAQAQQAKPAATPAAPKPPLVGDMAPSFTLPGATQYGLLAKPVSLSDYRGKTVVLAFFVIARTKG